MALDIDVSGRIMNQANLIGVANLELLLEFPNARMSLALTDRYWRVRTILNLRHEGPNYNAHPRVAQFLQLKNSLLLDLSQSPASPGKFFLSAYTI